MAPTIPAIERAKVFQAPPPLGAPHSVQVPGTKQEGRTSVYRHWQFSNELLQTLDPNVSISLSSSWKELERRASPIIIHKSMRQ